MIATDEAWCRMPASSALASATALRVPADVGALVVLVVGRHVIDGGEVEEVVDVAAVLVDPALLDAEALLREVADDGRDALAALPGLGQLRQALLRALAHEHEDLALAVAQQLLHEMAADEAGGAGDEVGQSVSSLGTAQAYTPVPAPPRPSPPANRAAPADRVGEDARGRPAPPARARPPAAGRSPRAPRGDRRASSPAGRRRAPRPSRARARGARRRAPPRSPGPWRAPRRRRPCGR